MKRYRSYLVLALGVFVVFSSFSGKPGSTDSRFLTYAVHPQTQDLQLYWKSDSGKIFGSIQNLKTELNRKHLELVFAMNGGMYKADHSPQGLFIQSHKTIAPLDTNSGKGNFYLKPNGVFYLRDDRKPVVCQSSAFSDNGHIAFATQSGPMLVTDGKIHPAFTKGSKNVNIRNGVGILPDGQVVFVLSKEPVNFYDFALYFQSLGCANALYLDGFVSRAYIPGQSWTQLDGNFGVLVGVTK